MWPEVGQGQSCGRSIARLDSLMVEAVGARVITSVINVTGKLSVLIIRVTTRKIAHLQPRAFLARRMKDLTRCVVVNH